MKKTMLLPLLLAALAGCGETADRTTYGNDGSAASVAPAAPATGALPKVTEQSGMLRIGTEPGGAQIFINGQRKGTSPTEPGQSFAVKLGEGSYTIEAKKSDGEEYEYLGQQADVFVADNTMQSVSIKLERRQTEQGKRLAQERAQRQAQERQQEAERHGYVISTDGQTVTDKKTGLMWMRCSLGQSWNGSSCAGKASEYTWEQAGQAARGYRHAGYSDWRMPSIDELKTLVYCSSGQRAAFGNKGDGGDCEGDYRRPTILEAAFPNTPSSDVWSGSPFAGYSDRAWGVYFHYGSAGYNSRSGSSFQVRLVRGGQ